MKILTLLILSFLTLFAQNPVIYTIEGKKDPRLEARYIVSYVSTGTSEECTTRKLSTGTRKPVIGTKVYEVKDENYSVKIPIALTEDENNCGYRLGGLELMILRKNDDQYSRFQLLGDYPNKDPGLGGQRADVIYQGSKGGFSTPHFVGISKNQTPIAFHSDKKYFRIVPETTFVCMTEHRIYEYELSQRDKDLREKWSRNDKETDFMCTIQMKLDTDGGKYHYHECPVPAPMDSVGCFTTTNPDFGVDEIASDTLHIDILVDKSKCTALRYSAPRDFVKEPSIFYNAPKPESSLFKSLF